MSQTGTISAHVFTARAQIPVTAATVTLSRRLTGKKHTLVAVRVTDENGEIAPVPIPVPGERGQSQPFATLDVRVEHPDYQMEIIEDVQVFPGVQSVQEVQLIPLAEHAIPRNSYNVVRVTPQPL